MYGFEQYACARARSSKYGNLSLTGMTFTEFSSLVAILTESNDVSSSYIQSCLDLSRAQLQRREHRDMLWADIVTPFFNDVTGVYKGLQQLDCFGTELCWRMQFSQLCSSRTKLNWHICTSSACMYSFICAAMRMKVEDAELVVFTCKLAPDGIDYDDDSGRWESARGEAWKKSNCLTKNKQPPRSTEKKLENSAMLSVDILRIAQNREKSQTRIRRLQINITVARPCCIPFPISWNNVLIYGNSVIISWCVLSFVF